MVGDASSRPAERLRVSCLVPTLDRGRYVLRTVESCLRAGTHAGVDVEVIVLDSQSRDGSWEALAEEFQNDARVTLLQNTRGSGPLPSWLAAAEHASGDYVTFVWSDDYLSVDGLRLLLAGLREGEHLSMGGAVIRDIDCEDAFQGTEGLEHVPSSELLESYLAGSWRPTSAATPVSPTSSLFSAAVFQAWAESVEAVCRNSPLRERVMWRAAIGPDLMLYLCAASMQVQPVAQQMMPVAQFSQHAGSITVGSLRWALRTGYLLARVSALGEAGSRLAPPRRAFLFGAIFIEILALAAAVPRQPLSDLSRSVARLALLREARGLARLARGDVGLVAFGAGMARAVRGRLSQRRIRRSSLLQPDAE